MLLIGASGVQCGLSRGEVCLGPVAEEVERSALVMQFLSCGLLSRCARLLRGIENVREVLLVRASLGTLQWSLSSAAFVLHCKGAAWMGSLFN